MSSAAETPTSGWRVVIAGSDSASSGFATIDNTLQARPLPSGRALAELWSTTTLLPALTPETSSGPFPGGNGARLWILEIPPDVSTDIAPLHATLTVDVGFVLDGAVTLELADGSAIQLQRGDAFVQPGAAHRWVNSSDARAAIGVVVIGTGPPDSSRPDR